MRCEDRVVWLDDTGGNLRRGVNSELKFRFLGVVNSQTFEEKSTKTGTSTSTERMEDENTLESIT